MNWLQYFKLKDLQKSFFKFFFFVLFLISVWYYKDLIIYGSPSVCAVFPNQPNLSSVVSNIYSWGDYAHSWQNLFLYCEPIEEPSFFLFFKFWFFKFFYSPLFILIDISIASFLSFIAFHISHLYVDINNKKKAKILDEKPSEEPKKD